MSIGKSSKRWASLVSGELTLAKVPLPVDLILAVIDVESGGKPGLVNQKSGASGLMQVMPVVLKDFNKVHSIRYSIDDIRDPQNPLAQIRVGVWILSQFWKSAYKYLLSRLKVIPMDELLRIADLFYVAGPAATKKKLSKVSPPTFAAIAERWPTWNALPHTIRVQKRVSDEKTNFDLTSISNWLKGNGKGSLDDPLTKKEGAAIALILLVLGWLLLKKR